MIASPPITGPAGYPIVGHVPEFLRDRLGFLSRCALRYGDVVKLRIGEPTLLLNNPDDIRYVLVGNAQNYDKTPRMTSKRGKRLSGEGLLTMSGDAHLRQRRLMQPSFHHSSVAVFADVILSSAQEMLGGWRHGSVVNIADELMNLAQRIVLRAIFSDDVERNMDKIAAAIGVRRRYIEHLFLSLLPFPEYWPTPINFEYRPAIKEIDRFIHCVIERRRANGETRQDLLSMLMQARYKDGSAMNDKEVRDEALTLSITGFETIGQALTWTAYLISQHDDVEMKVLRELNEALAGRPPSLAHLPKLNYLEMVLAESMRLYPPTWIYIRIARNNDTLPSGARVPAGGKLYLCPYVVQRNPKYFLEPERFDPERFAGDSRGVRMGLTYFPFGNGRRVCIGEALARMEMGLVLAFLTSRFKLELVSGQTIVPDPKVTLRPKNGILMRLIER